ncbi:hypothetical protein [Sphingomonas sp. SORGH_AS_0438]|uniref:hypothetical protein n=1 Tax=Sphingomonas sp. SORGH_AS_0438 TaxID=3041756 RepID=UPI00285EFA06|nr:hypothetical protein [Sphingomonas sp. SORGH_AS_0438]MDR6125973.1 hypothetical protein [Sphingomonas sp. SORGH_AS_0438]
MDLQTIALPMIEDKAMTSMTAISHDAGTPSTAVGATSATRQAASASAQGTSDGAAQGDTFGPAVVVELSDEAKEIERTRSFTLEERIEYHRSQYIPWAKKHGKSEEEQRIWLERLKRDLPAADARMLESRAQYEKSQKILATQQGNMEEALDRAGGAPQSLIDAVRTINDFRYDAGGAGSSVVYDDPKVRQQLRRDHGEEALQQITANMKAYDAAATRRAQNSAASLDRFGLEGSAFTMATGHFKMTGFTLGRIAGGYSMSFDPETSTFAVMRQGEDITAAIFNGTAFRSN